MLRLNINPEDLTYTQSYDLALTLWPVPFEELVVPTLYGNANVIVSGPEDGEPLVLLHGMNASSTMWYPNIEALSQHYRVYAIDFLLEPGKSKLQGEVNGIDEVVGWYIEIFDFLKLEKLSLIGASRGGWLAVNIALKAKASINSIVLLSPAQTFIWIEPGPKFFTNIFYAISPRRKRLKRVLETMSFNVDKIELDFVNQYYIGTTEAKINKSIAAMIPFPVDELKSLTIPVLLLIGETDIINNDKSIRKAKESIPNINTAIIKNASHFLSIDQPEVVNKRILDFLDGGE
jgi:pimeloyl-ACP methyl ester carboxylesterase